MKDTVVIVQYKIIVFGKTLKISIPLKLIQNYKASIMLYNTKYGVLFMLQVYKHDFNITCG